MTEQLAGLTLNQYQETAATTAVYPSQFGIEYCIHGLTNEAGEVAGAYKKFLRGDYNREEMLKRCKKEVGDTLWYAANLARELGFTLEEVAADNLSKLKGRAEAGTLKGDGDNR